MRQTQKQIVPHILRKQERPLLRTGRAEVERFFLEPLHPGLAEPKHTVPGPTQLSVDRFLWNHIQIKHMEADDTQNAGGLG
jgi:hypothetical protein